MILSNIVPVEVGKLSKLCGPSGRPTAGISKLQSSAVLLFNVAGD